MDKNLTAEYVRECLDYNPNTGVFMWKTRPSSHFVDDRAAKSWNTRYSNVLSGSLLPIGYFSISINNEVFYAHRLAWLYMTGEWPEFDIDHRDTNRSNNKWNNLRSSTKIENSYNKKVRSDNTSGIKGISFEKERKKWRITLKYNKENHIQQRFLCFGKAVKYLSNARKNNHGEFARAA